MPLDLENLFEKSGINFNAQQKQAIKRTKGPLLIAAGPGSGKTTVLIYRTINLLLCHDINPRNILVCTFTEKAAAQLKEKLREALFLFEDVKINLSEFSIGTIHSLCKKFLEEYTIHFYMGKSFKIIDELTQKLFVNQLLANEWNGLKEISVVKEHLGFFNFTTVLINYLNRITEELIFTSQLKKSSTELHKNLGGLYELYEDALDRHYFIDFAHLQKQFFELIGKNEFVRNEIQDRFKYIMVDEYQDTNKIQEKIFLLMASPQNNICVVGDDDQSLYRFRGATVQNILDFNKVHYPAAKVVKLETNYRSPKKIIDFINRFMDKGHWEDIDGNKFRIGKTIRPSKDDTDSHAIINIKGGDSLNKLIKFFKELKKRKLISSYHQIAVLCRQMRGKKSHVIKELLNCFSENNIPYYAPRARQFFDRSIVKEIFGICCNIFSFPEQFSKKSESKLYVKYLNYCRVCLSEIRVIYENFPELKDSCEEIKKDIIDTYHDCLKLKRTVLDIFYTFLAYPPFADELECQSEESYNLAMFSNLLFAFEDFFGRPNGEFVQYYTNNLFNEFFFLLFKEGIEEYEDKILTMMEEKIQVFTIHQSKGLEFPIVVVPQLDIEPDGEMSDIDLVLSPFYERSVNEPSELIGQFDWRRTWYVAFSRSQDLLVLHANSPTSEKIELKEFNDLICSDINKLYESVAITPIEIKEQIKEYSLTRDAVMYQNCPKQYFVLRILNFATFEEEEMLFGTLIHNTIEDIHKHILGLGIESLNSEKINEYLDKNYEAIKQKSKKGLRPKSKITSFKYIENYLENNRKKLAYIESVEEEVAVKNEDYFLIGRSDLVIKKGKQRFIYDFKSSKRPDKKKHSKLLSQYRLQLALYKYAFDKIDRIVDSVFLYWMGEKEFESSIEEIVLKDKEIKSSLAYFNSTIQKIRDMDFDITNHPHPVDTICKTCILRKHCKNKKLIQ